MKFYMLKTYLAAIALLWAIPSLRAQFDDVYYDPDAYVPEIKYREEPPVYDGTDSDGVTYYDNDEYAYYDDYDFYYSSRIRRFYNPYVGFGFYDPVYVGYNYYDPYAFDYYAYPGANIYFNFGIGAGFGWNNWYAPAPYYYGYNGWYFPSYTFFSGCGGFYPYGNYNNPYCPPPGHCGGSWGGGYNPGYGDHHGGYDDHYYGPRVAGNTGSSPRSPYTPPGIASPTVKARDNDVAQDNDRPSGLPDSGTPGRSVPSGTPVTTMPDHTPAVPVAPGLNESAGVVRQIPVDKELSRDLPKPESKRPVFRPDVEKYQPYPTPERSNPAPGAPKTDNPAYSPYTPQGRPSGTPPKDLNRTNPQSGNPGTPTRADQMPAYTPPARDMQDRPSYIPPPRQNERASQSNPSRNDDRPGYSPPTRSTDDSRSNDRPSYSPPPRHESSRSSSSPSHSPSSSGRDSAPSGSSRSSGGGGGSSSSSPRGRG